MFYCSFYYESWIKFFLFNQFQMGIYLSFIIILIFSYCQSAYWQREKLNKVLAGDNFYEDSKVH